MDKNCFCNNRVFSYLSDLYRTSLSLYKIRKIIKDDEAIAVSGHNHTTASDGGMNSLCLLLLNRLAGFKQVVVTDHNALRWEWKEKLYAEYSKRILGMEFCPGIEFSCFFDLRKYGGKENKEFHIVGIGTNPDDVKVREAIRKVQAGRDELVEKMLERIRKAGFSIIAYDELKKKSGGNVTLPDIAVNVRTRDGKEVDVQRFIDDHLVADRDCYVANRALLTIEEAVQAIKSSGGLVVWAHPKDTLGSLFDVHFEEIAQRLQSMGVGGVEAFRDNHAIEDVRKVKSFCVAHGLEVRAGADTHKPRDLFSYIKNITTVFEQEKSLGMKQK